jgi:hypothetical protein
MADIAKRLRPLTKEDALRSYQELKDFKCTKSFGKTREGQKALDFFFFKNRLAAKTKRHLSFLNALKNKKTFQYLKNKTRKIKKYDLLSSKKKPDEVLKNQYGVFQLYYGTINQFRPAAAKTLYCLLEPKVGILDFSSGWGGRCLAAMSLGIPYYGFDANKKLEKGYTDMVRLLDPDAAVKMTFVPSETADFSKFKYDLVFTSPPYFMLEEYEGMPAYEKEQGFLDKFFVPVLKKAWNGLAVGGHMALNMPEDMYEPVKKCLPRLHKKLKLPLMDRRAGEAARGEDVAVGSREQFEYIYVWKKVAGAKFDEEKKGCGVAI